MNFDQIIQLVLSLLSLAPLGLIFSHVLPAVARVEGKVTSILPAADADRVKSIVRIGVEAIEQKCAAMNGTDKKSEATRYIATLLNEAGLNVTPAMLEALIESTVFRMNAGQDPQATSLVPVVKP